MPARISGASQAERCSSLRMHRATRRVVVFKATPCHRYRARLAAASKGKQNSSQGARSVRPNAASATRHSTIDAAAPTAPMATAKIPWRSTCRPFNTPIAHLRSASLPRIHCRARKARSRKRPAKRFRPADLRYRSVAPAAARPNLPASNSAGRRRARPRQEPPRRRSRGPRSDSLRSAGRYPCSRRRTRARGATPAAAPAR